MLHSTFEDVHPDYRARVNRVGGLNEACLQQLVRSLPSDPALNLLRPSSKDDVVEHTELTLIDEMRGEQAIAAGEVSFVIMAGGASTRMGTSKQLAMMPTVGTSLLAWKVMQGGGIPTLIMSAAGGLDVIARHLQQLVLPPKTPVHVFEQFEGYRLNLDTSLRWLSTGVPDLHPLGHGDVGPALVESGVLDDNPNVKYAYIVNADNVMASPHSAIIGRHIYMGKQVTCEVVEKQSNDRGGVLAWANDRLQVIEGFRLPTDIFEEALYFNTNSFIVNVETLRAPLKWRWHRTRKQVGSALVLQHERLLQQYTEEYDTNYIVVPRQSRFCPVKNLDDLERVDKQLAKYRYK